MKILAVAGLLGGLFGCQPHHTILVQGTGFVSRDPDYVAISASIADTAATTDAVAAISARHMNALVDGLKAAGFKADNIQVSRFGISRHCEQASQGQKTCSGFDATNSLTVKLTELPKAGLLLGTLAKLGVEEIAEPSFEVNDDDSIVEQARKLAMENARKAAETYASGIGRNVLGVAHAEDGNALSSYYSAYGSRRRMVTASPVVAIGSESGPHATVVPLSIPKHSFNVSVYVEFELN